MQLEARVLPPSRTRKKPATVAEFEQWEAKRHSGLNYEFYYGEIIKKPGMKQDDAWIIKFLSRQFLRTAAHKSDGELLVDIDVYIDEYRKRIPHLAYFTHGQIKPMAKGQRMIPAFAIEILSESVTLAEIETKLQDYFFAGMQLVWYILPKSQKIYAYSAENVVSIYVAGQNVSAGPVLPDYEIKINDLFVAE